MGVSIFIPGICIPAMEASCAAASAARNKTAIKVVLMSNEKPRCKPFSNGQKNLYH
jgi:hypothetical protein